MDTLIHYDQEKEHMPIPPRGKHLSGRSKWESEGRSFFPKSTDLFHIKQGDLLVVLGDENPESAGIALVPGDTVLRNIAFSADMLSDEKEENL